MRTKTLCFRLIFTITGNLEKWGIYLGNVFVYNGSDNQIKWFFHFSWVLSLATLVFWKFLKYLLA